LVKTWEFERSHKIDPMDHTIANHDGFQISANNGKKFNHKDAHEIGNYNVLLDSCNKELYDNSKITNRQSHEIFHSAYPAFAWEVLQVFTGPPEVYFEWRHFGRFTGVYKGNKGNGQMIDVRGFGLAKVNGDLQLLDTHIFYDQNTYLEVMEGFKPHTDLYPENYNFAIEDKNNWATPENFDEEWVKSLNLRRVFVNGGTGAKGTGGQNNSEDKPWYSHIFPFCTSEQQEGPIPNK